MDIDKTKYIHKLDTFFLNHTSQFTKYEYISPDQLKNVATYYIHCDMYTDRQKYSCTWSDFKEITYENMEHFCGSVYNAVEMTSNA